MAMTNRRRATRLLDSDSLMTKVWNKLVQDFRSTLREDYFENEEAALARGVKYFRSDFAFERGYYTPPAYFKCRYQLEAFFKRYRFKDDLYTDQEIYDRTVEKFLSVQEGLTYPSGYSEGVRRVVQRARRLTKDILGNYDREEHERLCRFGKRASVGNPLKESYLDLKVNNLSGSPEHISWFDEVLDSDIILRESISELQLLIEGEGLFSFRPNYRTAMCLTYTGVPKSYKVLRGIMANTVLGHFYSYGLGRVIRDRLKTNGQDLRFLQDKHKGWAQKYSRTRTHVTADLSSASDSFTASLINRLVPREWYRLLKFGRIDKCSITREGVEGTYHLNSFMTMGIGFTFELQTLLFRCLLLSIQQLTKTPGRISVYGDDLIYPTRMHNIVIRVFKELGFKLNEDKTHVSEHFRESCGGDYYCGYDVRPFQPEGSGRTMSVGAYTAFLYKLYNGLLRRWDEVEIPSTLYFLRQELCRVQWELFYVPPGFSDTSGIILKEGEYPPKDWWVPSARWYFGTDTWTWSFKHLRQTRSSRYVPLQQIYYWNALRAGADSQPQDDIYDDIADSCQLMWKQIPLPKGKKGFVTTRSKLTGRRLRVLRPFVTKKDGLINFSQWRN